MGGADEEWVKAAMKDDTMVVELLVRLHCTPPSPPPPPPPTFRLQWTVRQRRSRPVSSVNTKRMAQSERASPSTPLSWSGATSFSGGSGGAEESSHKLSTKARSKLQLNSISDNEKAALKRSRKKKTLTELKDEENSLLKERRELKREISALLTNLEKQRAQNEKLKRIKVESQPLPDTETTSATKETASSARQQQKTTAGHPIPSISPPIISGNAVAQQSSTSNDSPTPPNADTPSSPPFMLPDLNMPFEDPFPDVIYGIS